MSNPLVTILVKALRDVGNANGTPVPGYCNPSQALMYMRERTERVHEIIAAALKQVPNEE